MAHVEVMGKKYYFMQRIKLNKDEVIALSKDQLEKYLKYDSNYAALKKEGEGKYVCTYWVNDAYVYLYNEVSGIIRSYVSNPYEETARIFAIRGELLLNGINNF